MFCKVQSIVPLQGPVSVILTVTDPAIEQQAAWESRFPVEEQPVCCPPAARYSQTSST